MLHSRVLRGFGVLFVDIFSRLPRDGSSKVLNVSMNHTLASNQGRLGVAISFVADIVTYAQRGEDISGVLREFGLQQNGSEFTEKAIAALQGNQNPLEALGQSVEQQIMFSRAVSVHAYESFYCSALSRSQFAKQYRTAHKEFYALMTQSGGFSLADRWNAPIAPWMGDTRHEPFYNANSSTHMGTQIVTTPFRAISNASAAVAQHGTNKIWGSASDRGEPLFWGPVVVSSVALGSTTNLMKGTINGAARVTSGIGTGIGTGFGYARNQAQNSMRSVRNWWNGG